MPQVKKPKVVTKVKAFKGTPTELARATYILVFLQTSSESEAQKASGLCGKTHSRIIERFIERGHAFHWNSI
jgi:hypothetical protein